MHLLINSIHTFATIAHLTMHKHFLNRCHEWNHQRRGNKKRAWTEIVYRKVNVCITTQWKFIWHGRTRMKMILDFIEKPSRRPRSFSFPRMPTILPLRCALRSKIIVVRIFRFVYQNNFVYIMSSPQSTIFFFWHHRHMYFYVNEISEFKECLTHNCTRIAEWERTFYSSAESWLYRIVDGDPRHALSARIGARLSKQARK